MNATSKKYFFAGSFVLLTIIDQIFKYIIRQQGGFYVCNKGVAFSLPIPWWIIYTFFALFFIFIVLYLLGKIKFESFIINQWGLILVAGGALGNLIDRLNFGCVVDFIDLKIFPVFNLADIFIFCGVVLILWKARGEKEISSETSEKQSS